MCDHPEVCAGLARPAMVPVRPNDDTPFLVFHWRKMRSRLFRLSRQRSFWPRFDLILASFWPRSALKTASATFPALSGLFGCQDSGHNEVVDRRPALREYRRQLGAVSRVQALWRGKVIRHEARIRHSKRHFFMPENSRLQGRHSKESIVTMGLGV